MRIRRIKRLWKQWDFDHCKFCVYTDDEGRCLGVCWVHTEKSVLGKVVYAGLAMVATALLLAIIL